MRRLACLLLPLLASGLLHAAPSFSAKAVAIYDVTRGTWLYRKGSDVHRAPASTIKVLSALTAVANAKDLSAYVTVSEKAAGMEPSQAGIRAGERYRIADLMKAMLVASSNDAAVAMAEGVCGTEAAFVERMGAMAAVLGAKDTRVTNASGLPDPPGMVTTAEDEILFIRKLREDRTLQDILAVKQFELVSEAGRRTTLVSHNKMLWRSGRDVRGKTGYTILAKHCFVSTAESDGRVVAVALMGMTKPVMWKEVEKAYALAFQSPSETLPQYLRKQNIGLSQVHAALARAGFPPDKAEAAYGPLTRERVAAFQKSRGLTADGVVGPHTWRLLEEAGR